MDKEKQRKPKLVIVMGPTGSGKSRLSIDLASHFPIEIINADSMQVYEGLDVLTNKVSLHERKGVPHHLLGTISPNAEFTSKDFRDSAIPTIDGILSRNCLPVIVGGTNYYIQALVSPFLLDDSMDNMVEHCLNIAPDDKQADNKEDLVVDEFTSSSYNLLKELDPDSVRRIHPNDHRKINHFLGLYARTGVLPSKLLQGKASENWGRVDNFRYNCCFICVDASLPVLDRYVEKRVDSMVDAGLLNEVYDIYGPTSDYTRGLRQAIGVREFEDFLRIFHSNTNASHSCITNAHYDSSAGGGTSTSTNKGNMISRENLRAILDFSDDDYYKIILQEAIDKLKANTRRLVRRQKRRLTRLQTLFGWDLHYVDATEAILCNSDESWQEQVVKPSVNVIRSFLFKDEYLVPDSEMFNGLERPKLVSRDLWTQHICEACGSRILRGAHEWEQHQKGRSHRKRVLRLKKKLQSSSLAEL
ncbi:PREDICTED: tRNA dimethylallyltransferase 2 isoform X1 [Nelumbo nucifera]|uniref:tRNA dimethylallyltransferase 2 isoform X1 n=1 Tax=Nelumbo nucifera TaxID=4432 RepID=A0A1U8AFE9_NELNU|nr:PREDICTED: tRNA dimethylallyltransferase 2 isoform X1 [Nelumbo nucifera]